MGRWPGEFLLGHKTDYFKFGHTKTAVVNVRRTHFQVVPADTRIVYAAQGESFEAAVLDMARPPLMSLSVHWLANYVMLSRATSLDGLLVLRLCTRQELMNGAPSYLLAEVDRLLDLERSSWEILRSRLEYLRQHMAMDSWSIIAKLFLTDSSETASTPLVLTHRLVTKTTAKNAPTPPVLSHRLTTKTSPFDAGQLAPAATRKETFKRSLGSASASTPLVTAKKQKTTAVTTLSLSNESPGLHCSPGSILSFLNSLVGD